MEIKISCKSIAKRRNFVQSIIYEYPNSMTSVRDFIRETVTLNLTEYINRQSTSEVIKVLSKEVIENQSTSGKISFGHVDQDRKPDINEAIATAIECFEDGIVVIFIDGNQVMKIDDTISLHDGSEVTFVRMTMLAGRMW